MVSDLKLENEIGILLVEIYEEQKAVFHIMKTTIEKRFKALINELNFAAVGQEEIGEFGFEFGPRLTKNGYFIGEVFIGDKINLTLFGDVDSGRPQTIQLEVKDFCNINKVYTSDNFSPDGITILYEGFLTALKSKLAKKN